MLQAEAFLSGSSSLPVSAQLPLVLHHKKFHIFRSPAFYSEISGDGCLGEAALLKTLNFGWLLFQASKHMKL